MFKSYNTFLAILSVIIVKRFKLVRTVVELWDWGGVVQSICADPTLWWIRNAQSNSCLPRRWQTPPSSLCRDCRQSSNMNLNICWNIYGTSWLLLLSATSLLARHCLGVWLENAVDALTKRSDSHQGGQSSNMNFNLRCFGNFCSNGDGDCDCQGDGDGEGDSNGSRTPSPTHEH